MSSVDGSALVDGSGDGFDIGRPAVTDYPPGAIHGPRELVDFEFLWVIRGGATLTFTNRQVHVRPGALYLLGPGERHTFTWDETQSSTHGYVHFGWAMQASESGPPIWPRSRPFTSVDPLAALCRYLTWLGSNRGDGWQTQTRAVLTCMLGMFISGPLPTPRGPDWFVIDAVVDYAAKAWADGSMRRLSGDEMARAASVSIGHLNRSFRASIGASPVAAIERVRLVRAEQLVARSSMTFAAVAEATGFADQFHFSRRFRRCFGVAPTDYRRIAETVEVPLPVELLGILALVERLAIHA